MSGLQGIMEKKMETTKVVGLRNSIVIIYLLQIQTILARGRWA